VNEKSSRYEETGEADVATKLLIVDDEPFTVDMLQTFLQLNGFETYGAFNGEDGLVLVKVEEPQIVILDLMLPDIEGYEVCKRIRDYPQTASLPVLVLSARAEAAAKEQALAAGADAFMVKPVQFPALLSELNRLLQKKAAPPTVVTVVPETPAITQSPAAPANLSVPPTANPGPGDRPNGTTTSPDQKPQNGSGSIKPI
jgi:DNA-binding response OmpR family regulator